MRCGKCGKLMNNDIFVEGTLEFKKEHVVIKRFWLCMECVKKFQKDVDVYILERNEE